MDMIEALMRGPGKVKDALTNFLNSRYAAELLLRIAGVEG